MKRERTKQRAELLTAALALFLRRQELTLTAFANTVTLYDSEGAEVANFRRLDQEGFTDLELGMSYGGPNPITGLPPESAQ